MKPQPPAPTAPAARKSAPSLLKACIEGDLPKLVAMLAAGVSPDSRAPSRGRGGAFRTGAMLAARGGHAQCLRALAEAGADLEATEPLNASRAIHTAALFGQAPDCLELLIGAGVDLEAKTQDGATAALLAAAHGRERHLEALLGAGADIESRDASKGTPAIEAARSGSLGCLRILAARGASFLSCDEEGALPEEAALAEGHLECAAFCRARRELAEIAKTSTAATAQARGSRI